MNRNEQRSTAIRLWTLAAVTAPLAHFTGAGYMASILAAGAILPLNYLVGNGFRNLGKLLSLLEWLWLTLVLAHLLPNSGDYWGSKGANLAVPLVLLGLSALARDCESATRICTALFWAAALMFGGIVLAAVGEVRLQWLKPVPGEWSGELIVTLLLPSLAGLLSQKEKSDLGTGLAAALLAGGLGALLQGVLSQPVSAKAGMPFQELGRTIGSVGYEPMVAVTMTLGWYCLCALLFQGMVRLLENWGLSKGYGRLISFLTTGGLIVLGVEIRGLILVTGCLILWILIPMSAQKK